MSIKKDTNTIIFTRRGIRYSLKLQSCNRIWWFGGNKKSCLNKTAFCFCGNGRDRTADTRIFSPVLYRLSYISVPFFKCCAKIDFFYKLQKKLDTFFYVLLILFNILTKYMIYSLVEY